MQAIAPLADYHSSKTSASLERRILHLQYREFFFPCADALSAARLEINPFPHQVMVFLAADGCQEVGFQWANAKDKSLLFG